MTLQTPLIRELYRLVEDVQLEAMKAYEDLIIKSEPKTQLLWITNVSKFQTSKGGGSLEYVHIFRPKILLTLPF